MHVDKIAEFAKYLHNKFCNAPHPDKKPRPMIPHCAFNYEKVDIDVAHYRWHDIAVSVIEKYKGIKNAKD